MAYLAFRRKVQQQEMLNAKFDPDRLTVGQAEGFEAVLQGATLDRPWLGFFVPTPGWRGTRYSRLSGGLH